MAHRAFAARRGGTVRRETEWIGISATTTSIASAAGATLVASFNAAALALRPFTIVRTHLEIHMVSDQSGVDERQQVAVGLAVVSDQAVAIGVTAVPTPSTDLSSDLWLAHQWCFNDFLFISGIGVHPNAGRLYTIDSKGMRKVNGDQDLVLVLENVLSSGSQTTMGGRLLVKLH